MQNLVKAHEKVKGLEWEPSYVQPSTRFKTRYKIPKKGRDPFRHLMRDYMKMEKEKDDRQYGFLDGNIRVDNPNTAVERFVEGQKLFLALFVMPEYNAGKCQGMLITAIDNQELRQGYLAQMLDEVRHAQQLMYLNRYFMKHYRDPAGFDNPCGYSGNTLIGTAARAAAETFIAGDPIECSMVLQVAGESAFTNPIFVGFPQAAAAQGEFAVPTVFLSIQSDESRHMANGYSTLCTMLGEDENIPFLQEDIEVGFWRIHRFVDPALSYLVEYTTAPDKKVFSYKEMWKRWVVDDWVGTYMAKLERAGLKPPQWLDQAEKSVEWISHTTAMVLAATWPLQWWRQDPITDQDMEWFEKHYPGWHGYYGKFWEEARRLTDPRDGMIAMQLLPAMPPLCQVCLFPCVYPRPDASTVRIRQNGHKIAFCGDACEWIYDLDPIRYSGHTTWFAKHHGKDLAEVVRQQNLIRPDGKTLIGQPSLDQSKMWTIDDIEKLGITIKDPMQA